MKKILVAEDDREINRLIGEYLLSQSYETPGQCRAYA